MGQGQHEKYMIVVIIFSFRYRAPKVSLDLTDRRACVVTRDRRALQDPLELMDLEDPLDPLDPQDPLAPLEIQSRDQLSFTVARLRLTT